MTLNEIASAIRNHISDGLSGAVANYSYSVEQLKEEIILMRNKLLFERATAGKVNLKQYYQTYPGVILNPEDISASKVLTSYKRALGFTSPRIISTINDESEVVLIYTINNERSFKVYRTIEYRDHKYRQKTKRAPFVYLDTTIDAEGFVKGWLMNTTQYESIRAITIQAVFSNPMDVPGFNEDKEFPAPLESQNDIITALTAQYVQYYRQMNIIPRPNTATDTVL